MKNYCLSLLLLFFSTVFSQNLGIKLDSFFASYDNGRNLKSGLAVGVYKNEMLFYEKYIGYSDIKKNYKVSQETLYNLASVSKQFTAACIVLLQQQGKLSLTDNLVKYFPELPLVYNTITLNHLLNHQSGIKDYNTIAWLKGIERFSFDDEDIYNWLLLQDLNFNPGSKFSYTNSGYWFLIQIIKKVSGKNINEFASQYLFKPLNMNKTVYGYKEAAKNSNKAIGYTIKNNELVSVNDDTVVGGSGVYSTINDLSKWISEIDNKQNLGKDFWNIMLNNREYYDENINYFNGFFIKKLKDGFKVLNHTGDINGFHTYLAYDTKMQIGVIVLANNDYYNPKQIGQSIFDIILNQSKEISIGKNHVIIKRLDKEILQQYTGRYKVDKEVYLIVELVNEELSVKQTWDENSYAIKPITENSFIVNNYPEIQFQFNELDKGKSEKLLIIQEGEQEVFNRTTDFTLPNYEMYVGKYYSNDLQVEYFIYQENSVLKCKIPNNKDLILIPMGRDGFEMRGMTVIFNQCNDGVSGFLLSHNRVKNIQFTKLKN